jgi:DNA-binding MarR family transcriptional regulator
MSAAQLATLFDLDRVFTTAHHRFDADLGAVHGIGLSDLRILAALDRAPGKRLRRVDLANQLGLTASGVTWLLRPLERRRLITSERDVHDARASYAVLARGGRELLGDALPTAARIAGELLDPGSDLGAMMAPRRVNSRGRGPRRS